MPWFRVATEWGAYKIEAEDINGALATAVMQKPESEKPAPEVNTDIEVFNELSGVDQAQVGWIKPLRQAYLGGKDLITDISDEEKRELEIIDEGVSGIPAAAAGLASEIATLALPVPSPLKTKALTKTVQFISDAAKGIGFEGLKAPTDGTSRLDRMAVAGAGAGVGGVIGEGLKKLRGIQPSDAAKVIEGLGNDLLTHGQRAKDGLVRTMESISGKSAVTNAAVREAQGAALEKFNQNLVERVAKKVGLDDLKGGRGSYEVVKARIDALYDKVWAGDIKVDMMGIVAGISVLKKKSKGLVNEGSTQLKVVIKQLTDELRRNKTPDGIKGRSVGDAVGRLKEAAGNAYKAGDKELGKMIDDLRRTLIESLPESKRNVLGALDEVYREWIPLTNAAASGSKGIFTGRQLEKAVKQNAAKTGQISGDVPLLKEAEAAIEVFDRIAASPGTSGLESAMNMVGSLGVLVTKIPGIKQIIDGKSPLQEKAARIAELLRRYRLSLPTTGAAAANIEFQERQP